MAQSGLDAVDDAGGHVDARLVSALGGDGDQRRGAGGVAAAQDPDKEVSCVVVVVGDDAQDGAGRPR